MSTLLNSAVATATGNLFGYNPTGAFAFEFFDRKTLLPLAKVFFMLAPESQTIKEGYKIKVTKTVDGVWVDDYGNDVKKIVLKGSLYSFYFGSPKTDNLLLNTASEGILNAFTGNYGINEFFKLRWIVSRIREGGSSTYLLNSSKIAAQYPELSALNLAFEGDSGIGNVMVVYHDYDDDNHYEVIFDDFECARDKTDPYTVNYVISMTTIEEQVSLKSVFANKWIRGGLKETVTQFLSDVKKSGTDILATYDTVLALVGPGAVGDIVSSAVGTFTGLMNAVNDIVSGANSDWNYGKVAAYAQQSYVTLSGQYSQLSTILSGGSVTSTNAETSEISQLKKDITALQNQLKAANLALSLISLDRLAQNTIQDTTVSNIQSNQIQDSQFGSSGNKPNTTGRDIGVVWYQVENGDTLAIISRKFFGDDASYANVIGNINGLTFSAFDGNAMAGKRIKIPSTSLTLAGNDANNVYYKITPNDTAAAIQEKVLGTDLQLDDYRYGMVDTSGDLAVIAGNECFQSNVMDAVSLPAGAISELFPGYGVALSVGEIPQSYSQQMIVSSIIQTIQSDPRTQSATLKKDTFVIQGGQVFAEFSITPITGSQFSQVVTAKLV